MRNRPGFFENYDRHFDYADINEFLVGVEETTDRRISRLTKEHQLVSGPLVEDVDGSHFYQHGDHLLADIASCHSTRRLGDELSIVALYKKAEIRLAGVAATQRKGGPEMKLSSVKGIETTFNVKIRGSDDYQSFDELRLLNNSIKHEGAVSKQLAKKYPQWTEDSELLELNVAYARLAPGVKRFVEQCVAGAYSKTEL